MRSLMCPSLNLGFNWSLMTVHSSWLAIKQHGSITNIGKIKQFEGMVI